MRRLAVTAGCLGALLVGGVPGRVSGQGTAVPASTASATLQSQLDHWFRETARRAPGEWGIAVADQSGRLVWGVEPTRPMIPASTVKVLTTGYARSVLGAEARKSTKVVGVGHIDRATGSWEGTWAIEVNGDPSLERSDFGPSLADLAVQLSDRGIRRLTGPLTLVSAHGQPDAEYPATWSKRHRGRAFAPLVGNLTIHGNAVEVTVAPATKLGGPVVLIGAEPTGLDRLVSVSAKTVSGRRSRVSLQVLRGGRYRIVGTLGIRAGARLLSRVTSDPESLMEVGWARALSLAGIEWIESRAVSAADGPRPEPTVLAEVRSPIFDSLAADINRRSSNLGAELLLRWAAANGIDPAARLTAHVQQITGDYGGVHLVDGSGLSDSNRVAPSTFIAYLARFPLSVGGRNFPMLLPPNGAGTLRKLANGLPGLGVVRAKTGTLGNVASLVGYLGRSDGVLLVSVMYHGGNVWAARQAQWKLFRELGAEGVVIPADSMDTAEELGSEPSR